MVCNLYFKIIVLIFLLLESKDIEMNQGPNNIHKSLSILYSNIRSIRNKFDYLTENFGFLSFCVSVNLILMLT